MSILETATLTERKDWLAARRAGVGASEAAALFGQHPYISLYSLWERKVNPQLPADPDEDDRRADGLLMEPRIAARYARKTGRVVYMPKQKLVAHPEHPLMLCSPDRMVEFNTAKEGEGLSIDCPLTDVVPESERGPLELKWLDDFSKDSEIPVYIQIQVQQQLACLNAQRGSVAILGSFRSFYWFDAERNQPFIDILAAKIDWFWNTFVVPGRPPDIDGSDATADAIKRLYPKENGETAVLDPEAMDWVEAWQKAKAATKAAEETEAQLYNKIRNAIGSATYGRLTNGQMLSLKSQTTESFVSPRKEFRVLRIMKKGGKRQ